MHAHNPPSFLTPPRFLLLNSTFIPISLKVSLDVCKVLPISLPASPLSDVRHTPTSLHTYTSAHPHSCWSRGLSTTTRRYTHTRTHTIIKHRPNVQLHTFYTHANTITQSDAQAHAHKHTHYLNSFGRRTTVAPSPTTLASVRTWARS